MEKTRTKYLGNYSTEIEHLASGAKIMTSAPQDNHGKGDAFSPTDLLAAAYSSCTLTIMGIAAATHGFDIDGAEVETIKIMSSNPRRVAELVVNYTFPHNNYNEKERKIIETSIKQCPVVNSLDPNLTITSTIKYNNL